MKTACRRNRRTSKDGYEQRVQDIERTFHAIESHQHNVGYAAEGQRARLVARGFEQVAGQDDAGLLLKGSKDSY
jgi:hypothetical protein